MGATWLVDGKRAKVNVTRQALGISVSVAVALAAIMLSPTAVGYGLWGARYNIPGNYSIAPARLQHGGDSLAKEEPISPHAPARPPAASICILSRRRPRSILWVSHSSHHPN